MRTHTYTYTHIHTHTHTHTHCLKRVYDVTWQASVAEVLLEVRELKALRTLPKSRSKRASVLISHHPINEHHRVDNSRSETAVAREREMESHCSAADSSRIR